MTKAALSQQPKGDHLPSTTQMQNTTTDSRSRSRLANSSTPDASPNTTKNAVYKSLGWLDRLLVLWILLAIIIGILLGNFVDGVGPALQRGKFVDVSVPIAVGLLVMMYPILCKVQFESLHEVFREREVWVQLGFSLVINWVVAPLLMVCRLLQPLKSLIPDFGFLSTPSCVLN